MPVDVSWPGNFLAFTKEDKDGKVVPDEAQLYLLSEYLHEIGDRLDDLTTINTSDLVDGSVTEAKLSTVLFTAATTFTATATGFTASITGTARYMVFGDMCVLFLPELRGTSNVNTMTITGMPSAIQPLAVSTFAKRIENGGVDAIRLLRLNASTTIDLFAGTAEGVFSTSSGKGLYSTTITYLIG